MEIAEILSLQAVLANLKAGSKKQLLQELAAVAAKETGVHERTIFDVLLERERLGSTGVGKGIAIPHGKLGDIDRLYGVFARLPSAVDFEAIDEQPVDLIFLLLAPETAEEAAGLLQAEGFHRPTWAALQEAGRRPTRSSNLEEQGEMGE